jgi:hypothetical protein
MGDLEMSSFSASDAAMAGFHVLRRHWRVVVGWALFNVLAMMAMVVITVIVMVPLVSFAHDRAAAAAMGGAVGGLVAGLGTAGVQVVIMGALFRLMLRDDPPEFLYLRLGADEFRLIGVILLMALVAIPVLVTGGALVAAVSDAAPGVAIPLAALILAVGYVVILRFSLSPVASFAQRRLQLMVGWRLSRGRTAALVGMAVVTLCLVAVIAIALWVGLFVLGGVLTGFQDLGQGGRESLAAHPGRYVFQVCAELLLAPVFLVLTQAPWVAAYQALSASPNPSR